jgi:rsbT co-antagonist protein RsbR
MSAKAPDLLHAVLDGQQEPILRQWLEQQAAATAARRSTLISQHEMEQQSREFLSLLQNATRSGASGFGDSLWQPVKEYLTSISRSRALQGFTPSETATFVFSLKQPAFDVLRAEWSDKDKPLADALWDVTVLLDQLGLFTTEVYLQSREDVIGRQQHELLELSTPVVQLWDDILAVPLVGTLDSARAQVVMETLLQKIVDTGAAIAIIDITGVPTVDTLVAQHLLKTIAATRLMGADCIISGIRPQIAQTIVHLGVDLGEVITKGTLADAFAVALKRTGTKIDAAR